MILMIALALVSCNSNKKLDEDKTYNIYDGETLVFYRVDGRTDYIWTDDYFCLKEYGTFSDNTYSCVFGEDVRVEEYERNKTY